MGRRMRASGDRRSGLSVARSRECAVIAAQPSPDSAYRAPLTAEAYCVNALILSALISDLLSQRMSLGAVRAIRFSVAFGTPTPRR